MKRIAGVFLTLWVFSSSQAVAAESELLIQFRQYLKSPAEWHTEEGLVLKHALMSTEPTIRNLAGIRLRELFKNKPKLLAQLKADTGPISLVADAEIVHAWIESLEFEQQKSLDRAFLTPKHAEALLKAGRGKELPPAYRFAANRLPVLKRIRQTLLTDFYLASMEKHRSSAQKLSILHQFDLSLRRVSDVRIGLTTDLRLEQFRQYDKNMPLRRFRAHIADGMPNLIPYHLTREFKVPQAATSKMLRSMLDDKDAQIRAIAKELIAERGSDDDVLFAGLSTASRLRNTTLQALSDIIERIRPEHRHAADGLKRLYSDPRSDVRCDVIAAVVRIRKTDADARRLLGRSLENRDVFVQIHAISAMRDLRLTNKNLHTELIPALGSKEATVLTSAARRLATLGRTARPAATALKKLLKHSDERVRCYAAVALYHAFDESKEYAPIVIAALNSKRAAVRLDAIRALTRFGPAPKSAIPELMKRLSDRDDRVASAALEALRLAMTE